MEINYRNCLNEYTQKEGLPIPSYITEQCGGSSGFKFLVTCRVGSVVEKSDPQKNTMEAQEQVAAKVFNRLKSGGNYNSSIPSRPMGQPVEEEIYEIVAIDGPIDAGTILKKVPRAQLKAEVNRILHKVLMPAGRVYISGMVGHKPLWSIVEQFTIKEDLDVMISVLTSALSTMIDSLNGSPFLHEIREGLLKSVDGIAENWGMSREQRNKLMHAINGNGVKIYHGDTLSLNSIRGIYIPFQQFSYGFQAILLPIVAGKIMLKDINSSSLVQEIAYGDFDPQYWINTNSHESVTQGPLKSSMLMKFPTIEQEPIKVYKEFVTWMTESYSDPMTYEDSIKLMRKVESFVDDSVKFLFHGIVVSQELSYMLDGETPSDLDVFDGSEFCDAMNCADMGNFAMKMCSDWPFSIDANQVVINSVKAELILGSLKSSAPVHIETLGRKAFIDSSPIVYEMIKQGLMSFVDGIMIKKPTSDSRVVKVTVNKGMFFSLPDLMIIHKDFGVSPQSIGVFDLGMERLMLICVVPEGAEILLKDLDVTRDLIKRMIISDVRIELDHKFITL